MTKVFTFCIYGNLKKYCFGLLENLKIINKDYPDFETWIYYGNDVKNEYIDELKTYKNVKLIFVDDKSATLMVHRFFAIDHKDIEIMFVRDADSRIHKRDQWCINEFIKSDKLFHIIRDHYHHKKKIMGGMWGVKKGIENFEIECSYVNWVKNNENLVGKYQLDQTFLEEVVYNKVKNVILIHIDKKEREQEGEDSIIIQEPNHDGYTYVGANIEIDEITGVSRYAGIYF
jgi:hypothetical protein